MSGGREYDSGRFWALAYHVRWLALERDAWDLDPEQVFAVMFLADFEAYRRVGRSITGSSWAKLLDGWSTTLTYPA